MFYKFLVKKYVEMITEKIEEIVVMVSIAVLPTPKDFRFKGFTKIISLG